MTRGLSLPELLELHRMAIARFGGTDGIRDLGAIHSALTQPFLTFGGDDRYPSLADKAAAVCFVLVMNHPFLDGNKRVGHAAMEAMLMLNGFEISAPVDEQEAVIVSLAGGKLGRDEFTCGRKRGWFLSRLPNPHDNDI